MGHLQQFEAELRSRIEAIEPGAKPDDLIHWLKEQVLASYKNGLASRQSDDKKRTQHPAKRSAA